MSTAEGRTGRLWRSRRRSKGAAAVEAALVTPLLILLVFAIIEFGFVFKNWLAVVSATRAGVRTAAAEPRQATFAQDAANQVAREGVALGLGNVTALWVYQADTAGFPVGAGGTFNSCNTNCIKFSYSGGQFTPTSGTWPATSQDACQGQQDSIGVYMQYKSTAITGLFFKSMSLKSHTVMVLEPIPTLNGCK